MRYEPALATRIDYVDSRILIEFGSRSTGEPLRIIAMGCDAAVHISSLSFPTASPRVMTAERTFWEKATAAHVFCLEQRTRGARYARHWYDLVRLDDAGVADRALADRALGRTVALHKRFFFKATGPSGTIDYLHAVEGKLRLVPDERLLRALDDDYKRMLDSGLLEYPAPSFDDVMHRCRDLEARANG